MSAGPAAVFANLLASLGGPRWAGPRWAVAARLSGRRSVNQLSAVLGAFLGIFSALGGHFLDAGTSLFRAWGTRPRKHVSGGGTKIY